MKKNNGSKNRIPRTFYRITGKMNVDTNFNKVGDILHIFKNNFGYLALNERTGTYSYCFVSMIRNQDIFKIISIL